MTATKTRPIKHEIIWNSLMTQGHTSLLVEKLGQYCLIRLVRYIIINRYSVVEAILDLWLNVLMEGVLIATSYRFTSSMSCSLCPEIDFRRSVVVCPVWLPFSFSRLRLVSRELCLRLASHLASPLEADHHRSVSSGFALGRIRQVT